MILLIFSYLIIVTNLLFFGIGILNDIGFVGGLIGGLIGAGTDPVILLLGALLGAGLVAKPLKFSIIYLIIGAVFLTMLSHVMLDTTIFIVDVIRFDALLIIPAIIVIITSFFAPKNKVATK